MTTTTTPTAVINTNVNELVNLIKNELLDDVIADVWNSVYKEGGDNEWFTTECEFTLTDGRRLWVTVEGDLDFDYYYYAGAHDEYGVPLEPEESGCDITGCANELYVHLEDEDGDHEVELPKEVVDEWLGLINEEI